MSDRKTAELQKIKREVENLRASPLYEYRLENNYLPVIGEGDPAAELMFIGEAPGKNEAESGRPFVGAAGKLLDRLLASIGLERDQVYITNIVKDRPPENRDPKPEEIRLYSPFLLRQIEIIQPKVIATLGRFSMDFIMEQFNAQEKGKKISKLHGKPVHIKAPHGKVILLPLYHPAFALYRRDQKEALEEDFRKLLKYI
jgi:uracil-DNA glycosylase